MPVGRKPKPTKLKLLQGNPGHRPLNEGEPEPEVATPDPPEQWAADSLERREWDRIVPELLALRLLTRIDRAALVLYCQAWARNQLAEAEIAEKGLTIATALGNIIQNPAVGVANKAAELAHKFLTEFGMTPSSRSRVSAAGGGKAAGRFEGIV